MFGLLMKERNSVSETESKLWDKVKKCVSEGKSFWDTWEYCHREFRLLQKETTYHMAATSFQEAWDYYKHWR